LFLFFVFNQKAKGHIRACVLQANVLVDTNLTSPNTPPTLSTMLAGQQKGGFLDELILFMLLG